MKIVLPWPDRRLSPNARVHWRAKAPVTKKARTDATLATYGVLGCGLREVRAALRGEHKIALTVTFYPPDKRHRDDDGMVSSFKAARDGIADALGVDDRRFRAHYFFAEPEKPGRIEVAVKAFENNVGKPVDAPHSRENAVNGLPPNETEAA